MYFRLSNKISIQNCNYHKGYIPILKYYMVRAFEDDMTILFCKVD